MTFCANHNPPQGIRRTWRIIKAQKVNLELCFGTSYILENKIIIDKLF